MSNNGSKVVSWNGLSLYGLHLLMKSVASLPLGNVLVIEYRKSGSQALKTGRKLVI